MMKSILTITLLLFTFGFGQMQYSIVGVPDFGIQSSTEEFIFGVWDNPANLANLDKTKFHSSFRFQNENFQWFSTDLLNVSLSAPIGKNRGLQFDLKPLYRPVYEFNAESESVVYGDTLKYDFKQTGRGGVYLLNLNFGNRITDRINIGLSSGILFGNILDGQWLEFHENQKVDSVSVINTSKYVTLLNTSVSPVGIIGGASFSFHSERVNFSGIFRKQFTSKIKTDETMIFQGEFGTLEIDTSSETREIYLPDLFSLSTEFLITPSWKLLLSGSKIYSANYFSTTLNGDPLSIQNGYLSAAGVEYQFVDTETIFRDWKIRLGGQIQEKLYAEDYSISDRCITGGFGIPLRNGLLNIDISGKYGFRTHSTLEQDQRYFEFFMTLTSSQKWFISRKKN